MKASSSYSFPRPATPPPRHARCVPVCPLAPTAGSGGVKSGTADICWQLAPLRPGTQDPQDSVEHSSRVLPGAASAIGASLRSQDRFDQLPLGIAEFPSSSHALLLSAFLPAENSK